MAHFSEFKIALVDRHISQAGGKSRFAYFDNAVEQNCGENVLARYRG